MKAITIFYIPCKDLSEVRHLSKLLLDNALVACTNTFPIESAYMWQGSLTHDNEQVLVAKTLVEKTDEVSEFVTNNHSYQTPCIATWQIQVNEAYFEWIKSVVN